MGSADNHYQVVGISTNTVSERLAGVGVTIDSCLIKDGKVYIGTADRMVTTNASGYAVASGSVISSSTNTQFWHHVFQKSGDFHTRYFTSEHTGAYDGAIWTEYQGGTHYLCWLSNSGTYYVEGTAR